jgi:hypothetical protein
MKKNYFSTFQLILLALFSALVVAAKIALRMPIQLSGHSGLFWMAIVIVGMRVVPKPGAGSVIGVTSGILAGFLGLGDFGVLDTFLSYALLGIVADLILWVLGGDAENVVVAVLAGTLGHTAKFVVKWIFGLITGAPLGFVALGLLKAIVSYIVFGALGGFLGWLTIGALKKAGFFAYMAEKK